MFTCFIDRSQTGFKAENYRSTVVEKRNAENMIEISVWVHGAVVVPVDTKADLM